MNATPPNPLPPLDRPALEALAGLFGDPLLLVGIDGTVVLANGEAERAASAEPGTLVGRRLDELFSDEPIKINEYLARFARSRQPLPGALTWRRPPGAPPAASGAAMLCSGAVAVPRTDRGPAVIALRLRPRKEGLAQFLALNERIAQLTTEIQERRRAEEALKRVNADLLQFAAAASHDLKEPLGGISRLSSFVSMSQPSLLPENEERLERIRTLCDRLATMVSALLRHASVGLEVHREPCDLNQLVHMVVNTAAEELRANNCQVVVRGDLPTIHADPMLLERVFANLISNGVKFNRSEVKRVEIWREDGAIAFRDNGIGVAPQHFNSIFGIFKRLHSGDKFPGVGVGLSLARRIVEAHGGSIGVESAPGEGSTFRVRLPALEGTDGPSSLSRAAGDVSHQTGARRPGDGPPAA